MKNNLRQGFFIGIGGFILGVLVSGFLPLSFNFGFLLFGLSLSLLILIFLIKEVDKKLFILVIMFLLGTSLGVVRLSYIEYKLESTPELREEKITVKGQIVEEPDKRESQMRLVVKLEDRFDRFLVTTSPYGDFEFGDYVEVVGMPGRIENFTSDTGRVFDYINFLKVQKIIYQIPFAQVEKLDREINLFQKGERILFKVKKSLVSQTSEVIEEPANSLLAGLLFGDRRGLGKEWENDFRQSGLIHIVVLSGYNMAIVAIFIMAILSSFISRKWAISWGIISIILFALMVSTGPTVVRASIMAILALLARGFNRSYDVGVGLVIALFIMVLWNPLTILYDVGFQLSFIATAGLIYLAPMVEKMKFLQKIPWSLREIIVTTFSAQIAVIPWLSYQIGEVSLVSLFANVLALPAVPFAMLFGFLTSLAGFINFYLAFILGGITLFLLNYILFIANLFGSLSFATIFIPEINLVVILFIYGLLIFLVFRYYSQERVKYQQLIKKD